MNGDIRSSGEFLGFIKSEKFPNGSVSHWFPYRTSRTLNGQDNNPLISYGGKIYYAFLFFEKLTENFENSISRLFKDTIQQMDKSGIETEALRRVKSTQENYYRLKDKKAFYAFWKNFTHPSAENAEKEYLAYLKNYWLLRVRKNFIVGNVSNNR